MPYVPQRNDGTIDDDDDDLIYRLNVSAVVNAAIQYSAIQLSEKPYIQYNMMQYNLQYQCK
jgi:hypothetical protein